ncbi:MAG TPA: hypothetical protein VGB30_02180 [bacterium]
MKGISLLIILSLSFSQLILAASCFAPKEEDYPEGTIHGEVWLTNINDPDNPGAYFDFSEGEVVYGDEARQRGDIYIEATFIRGNPALNVALNDQQPDSLLYDTTAPGWGDRGWAEPPDADTPSRIPIYHGHNVWVRTGEGNTAKFKIVRAESNADVSAYDRLKLQWIYQPDGSNSFQPLPGG